MKSLRWSPLLALAIPSHAWDIYYYSESRCSGNITAHSQYPDIAEATCRLPSETITTPRAVVRSARLTNLYEDDGFLTRWGMGQHEVRFYDNNECFSNCTHRHIIGTLGWDDCVSWPEVSDGSRFYKSRDEPAPIPVENLSFNIEVVGNAGYGEDGSNQPNTALSDGFCVLSHGDKIEIRGQAYRMQQVAASWFHDIPAAEWDDKIHVKSTEHRFAEHGDVDMFGRTKMWLREVDYMHTVRLELWDPKVQVKASPSTRVDDSIWWALTDICSNVDEDNQGLMKDSALIAKVPSLDVVQICKEYRASQEDTPREVEAASSRFKGGKGKFYDYPAVEEKDDDEDQEVFVA